MDLSLTNQSGFNWFRNHCGGHDESPYHPSCAVIPSGPLMMSPSNQDKIRTFAKVTWENKQFELSIWCIPIANHPGKDNSWWEQLPFGQLAGCRVPPDKKLGSLKVTKSLCAKMSTCMFQSLIRLRN